MRGRESESDHGAPPGPEMPGLNFCLRTLSLVSRFSQAVCIMCMSTKTVEQIVHFRTPQGTQSMPSLSPQKTCRLMGKLSCTLKCPQQGKELVQRSAAKMKSALFLLYPRFN